MELCPQKYNQRQTFLPYCLLNKNLLSFYTLLSSKGYKYFNIFIKFFGSASSLNHSFIKNKKSSTYFFL